VKEKHRDYSLDAKENMALRTQKGRTATDKIALNVPQGTTQANQHWIWCLIAKPCFGYERAATQSKEPA
jgi:hypothetical protein